MNLSNHLLCLASAICMGAANLFMKWGVAKLELDKPRQQLIYQIVSEPRLLGGFLLVGLASASWLKLISRTELTTAYPLFVSITYAVVALGSVWFFGERISLQKLAGLTLLLSGIILVARS